MPTTTTERVAAEVRAELGRQRKTGSDLARALNRTQSAISRRLIGEIPFDLAEIEAVAAYLGIPVSRLVFDAPSPDRVAS